MGGGLALQPVVAAMSRDAEASGPVISAFLGNQPGFGEVGRHPHTLAISDVTVIAGQANPLVVLLR